jgi:hypothetical protein
LFYICDLHWNTPPQVILRLKSTVMNISLKKEKLKRLISMIILKTWSYF